jgi:hypothetical protein
MPRWRRCGAPRETIAFNKARRPADPTRPRAFFPDLAGFRDSAAASVRDDARVPLDEFLPDSDANEVHSTRIAASPEDVTAAARTLTARDVPLMSVLMAMRRLPARVARRRGPPARASGDRPLLDGFTRAGFFVLAEQPDELILGVVGRFWTLDSGIEEVAPSDFVTFAKPGFAKAVLGFHVREVAGGTVLTTETRIQGTDEEARRKFRRYWRVVMPGSALIRRAWLRAIRKRAERG